MPIYKLFDTVCLHYYNRETIKTEVPSERELLQEVIFVYV